MKIEELMVDSLGDEWFIVWPDGDKYTGPYKRAQDAKGQLTRLLQGYTPAARKLDD